MILQFFKSNKLLVLLFLPIIALLFWLPGILSPIEVNFSQSSPLFQWIASGLSPLASKIIALFIVVFSALLINSVVNNNEIFDRNTFLPALMYLIIMSAIREYQLFTPIIISNLFWILAFSRLFNIHRQKTCKREVFDATIFILIGALFYFPSIIMLPIVWIALKLLRPFAWREWLIPFFAFVLFIIYGAAILFWNNALNSWNNFIRLNSDQYSGIEIHFSWMYYIVFAVVFILINFSAFQLSVQSKGSSLRFRKIVSLFMFIILLTIILLGVVKFFPNENIYTLASAVPLSLLLTFYFYYAKVKWLSQLMFYTVFLILLVNIYF